MSLRLPVRPRRMHIDPAYAIVNLVLLLIFFFMVSGQETRLTTQVELAETQALPPGKLPPPLLEIISDNDWRLDGQPIRPELLAAALPASDIPVHLLIDRSAPAELLLAILRRPELTDRQIRFVTRRMGVKP